MSEEQVAGIRREYTHAALDEGDLAAEPVGQFRRWMGEALAAGVVEPTAMTVATVDGAGRPSARVVLLKGFDERGFVFFTNYGSRKGRELAGNPRAALVFHWPELDRQVRIEGRVERTSRGETEAYFASRPVKSQLGAWASRQSEPVADRAALEAALAAVTARFAGGEVPAPEGWGGYRVRPERIEFWQGRRSRLHDRLVYRLAADPTTSDEPTKPADPRDLADPTEPADSVEPAEPVELIERTKLAEPIGSTEPVNRTEPAGPDRAPVGRDALGWTVERLQP